MASTASAPGTVGPGLAGWRSGVLIGWHLCSLDAPLVAGLWTWFAVRVSGTRMPAVLPFAMALAVWILYAADRLLDARGLREVAASPSRELEARHYFHWRHRRVFGWGIVLGSVMLGFLVRGLPVSLIERFGAEGVLLAAWLGWIHQRTLGQRQIPKEPLVGVLFAAAVFLPALTRWADVVPALLYGVLLTVNGLFIRVWEHRRANLAMHVAKGAWVLCALCAACALTEWAEGGREWRLAAACGVAAGLLLALHHRHRHVERTTLRAAADAVLLTPVLFLFAGR